MFVVTLVFAWAEDCKADVLTAGGGGDVAGETDRVGVGVVVRTVLELACSTLFTGVMVVIVGFNGLSWTVLTVVDAVDRGEGETVAGLDKLTAGVEVTVAEVDVVDRAEA